MIMSKRFSSWASNTPFSTAIASTSSTVNCAGRVLHMAAMTEPSEFLMIAPMLEGLWSCEVAPSTFILNRPGGGAVQPGWLGKLWWGQDEFALQKSWISLWADSHIWRAGLAAASWMIWFLFYQINQAVEKKTSRSKAKPRFSNSMATSEMSSIVFRSLMGHSDQQVHTLAANSQWIKAWGVHSKSRLHRGQDSSTATPLDWRFFMVGRASLQALHANILIFGGRFRCQSFLQSWALASPDEHSPTSCESTTLTAL